jgi:hypothetical protein
MSRGTEVQKVCKFFYMYPYTLNRKVWSFFLFPMQRCQSLIPLLPLPNRGRTATEQDQDIGE